MYRMKRLNAYWNSTIQSLADGRHIHTSACPSENLEKLSSILHHQVNIEITLTTPLHLFTYENIHIIILYTTFYRCSICLDVAFSGMLWTWNGGTTFRIQHCEILTSWRTAGKFNFFFTFYLVWICLWVKYENTFCLYLSNKILVIIS